MGRIKLPRCDNCGAPVEFAAGATEARCEYCSEVLIRELLPPTPAAAPHWSPPRQPPAAAAAGKVSVAPFVLVGVATLVIAGASSIATFASHFKSQPQPAPVLQEQPASPVVREAPRAPATVLQSEPARSDTQLQPASAAATARARVRTQTAASAAPT
ncbi:MAG TPA: hypothetical protein VJV79_40095, partial [Polyangiaceae bacterium]|nr:hypothetical protein [Polyangiaceae bacterium]